MDERWVCDNNKRAKANACFCAFLKDRGSNGSNSGSSALQSTFGGSGIEANDIWGWTDTASGREFALLGLSDGTAFVEITNAVNPTYLGKLPTATSSSAWRDVKVYNNHAFIMSEASGHGIQFFDLTQLLTASTGTVFTAGTTYTYTQFGNAHNIAVNEGTGFAYAVQ